MSQERFSNIGEALTTSPSEFCAQQRFQDVEAASEALVETGFFGPDVEHEDLFGNPITGTVFHGGTAKIDVLAAVVGSKRPRYRINAPGVSKIVTVQERIDFDDPDYAKFPIAIRQLVEEKLELIAELTVKAVSATMAAAYSQLQQQSMTDAFKRLWSKQLDAMGVEGIRRNPAAILQADMILNHGSMTTHLNSMIEKLRNEIEAHKRVVAFTVQHWFGIPLPVGVRNDVNDGTEERVQQGRITTEDVTCEVVYAVLPPGLDGEQFDITWLEPDLAVTAPHLFASLGDDAKAVVEERQQKMMAARQRMQQQAQAAAGAPPAGMAPPGVGGAPNGVGPAGLRLN